MRRITSHKLTWSRRERLRYLESLVFWRGSFRRADLLARFDIGVQRVSADIQLYIRLNPGGITYDRNQKTYVAAKGMKPVMGATHLEDGISLLGKRPARLGPWVDRVVLPMRRVNLGVIQQVFRAVVQNQSIRIRYASLNSSTFRWRWISPHAFAFDGYRWHARAFCHEEKKFKDFVLGRIAKAGPVAASAKMADADKEWTQIGQLSLEPSADLSAADIKALKLDFGLTGGRYSFRIRDALRIYALAQLGLSPKGLPHPSRWRLATR